MKTITIPDNPDEFVLSLEGKKYKIIEVERVEDKSDIRVRVPYELIPDFKTYLQEKGIPIKEASASFSPKSKPTNFF